MWGDQTATVSYVPADTDLHYAPIVTDHAVTVSTANRRPTLTFTQPADDEAPPGTLEDYPVGVADPDITAGDLEVIAPGDTATNPANAVTVTVSVDRADVVSKAYYSAGRVYVEMGISSCCAGSRRGRMPVSARW